MAVLLQTPDQIHSPDERLVFRPAIKGWHSAMIAVVLILIGLIVVVALDGAAGKHTD